MRLGVVVTVMALAAGTLLAERPSGSAPHVGLVPWRDPAGDLAAFFAGATGYRGETRILSHLRLSLAQQLGHPPMGDDLLLRYYRVLRGSQPRGSILVRRVKGEYGAIEFVLAVTPEGRVRGVRLQRQREPAAVAAALQRPAWHAAFVGKTADSAWRVGEDLPLVPPEARRSAQAIAHGARTALILLRAAETVGHSSEEPHHGGTENTEETRRRPGGEGSIALCPYEARP